MTPLEAALKYAELGWSVVPLHTPKRDGSCTCAKGATCPKPGKHPRLSSWLEYQRRPAREDEIRAWWKTWPSANVGVITGKVSGILIMDVDGDRGRATLRGRPLPDGPVSVTGRGEHRVYWYPNGSELRNFAKAADGLDARAEGGLFVAPPSRHAIGTTYQWQDGCEPWELEPPEMPEWFAAQFTTPTPNPARRSSVGDSTAPDWLKAMLAGVSEGGRNDALTRVAGHYFNLGLGFDDVLPILEATNARFGPPLPLEEVEQVARSIHKAHRRKELEKPSAAAVQLEESTSFDDDEKQRVRLEVISKTLRVTVTRVVRYLTDPPRYELTVNGTRVSIADVDGLIAQGRLRSAIAAATGKIIFGVDKDEWWGVAQLLLDACEDLEVVEATTFGTVSRWVNHYLRDYEGFVDNPWAENALEERPFRRKHHVWVSLVSLRAHIRQRLDEKVSPQDLATLLRTCGAESEQLRVQYGSRSAAPRAWRLPPALVEPGAWADASDASEDS